MSNSYPPLDAVRKHLRIKWYRSKVEPSVLREMTVRSNMKGLAQALGHLVLYLATGALTFWLWSRQIWLGFAAAMFLHGTVSSFLRGISTHELAHGTVFRTKWLNKAFLYLFSLLNWWNHFDYAMSHTYHHRYTLHPDGDREVLLPLKPVPGPIAVLQLLTVNLFTPPGRTFSSGGLFPTIGRNLRAALGMRDNSRAPSSDWLRALHADQPRERRKSAWWSRASILFHGAVVVTGVLTGYWVLPIVITVAPFTASAALYLVGLPQHCGLKGNEPDFRKCARSVKLGPILEFLYWRMNWHAEHHMYAAVPFYNLKKLSRVVASDMPAPRSLGGAWREMRETWKLQQRDPSYQFNLPLPPSATVQGLMQAETSGPAESPDAELEKSMGELAPDGL